MKALTCDLCDHTAQSETFEGWMQALMPHYTQQHADYMKSQSDRSEAEQKSEQNKWMQANKARFDNI